MSDAANLDVFTRRESEVRGYVRAFPTVFDRASGSTIVDADGREYLDFFAGAGVLNYGHNNPAFTEALIAELERGGIMHGLDMATSSKRAFIEAFERLVLEPRGFDHKLQFTGPTGANAVEAALKVARQATGRQTVVAFTNAFHGLSLGALAATGNSHYRGAAGVGLDDVVRLPYDGYLGDGVDTLDLLEKMLDDPGSGLDLPAAVIVEAVQGEGGINVASVPWLQRLRAITAERGILLILDEIQAGVGRTGTFFAFEAANIVPDLVTVSKSISGSGLPMSLVLLRPEVDVWQPGAHTGTFRGNNLAFVTARVALERYWADDAFTSEVARKSALLRGELEAIAAEHPELELRVRGRGLMYGLVCELDRGLAGRISKAAFARGLVIETSGAHDEVLKFLPALTITDEELRRGLEIVRESLAEVKGQ
ncbi:MULTISPECIES: diaminobutyrate--2-oxoglutarate transaminase [Agromyces]|jgi:diaminobutyrate-2-oxoglutarate transaminase|uniref:diaminobutyrate--2-oxoglutarate transaminase n=1 Tax=Agromyces TaxID=33877 RepID=UPI001E288C2A|nr:MULTISPECIES: diaminobutyrate--2-oxoglutarate transaminase [Agromyces]MCD1570796.1 diaminobutyrate--2-oxoglutarate transaminase [Agromyces mediolanus]GLU90989.1 diaminobutyrate--2-oxoglutarate transaminase [Agromyces sp. NBRC 114283]